MTPDQIIEIVTAFKEGKEVECQFKNRVYYDDNWSQVVNPCWNFDILVYRIKPTPKKRLITVEELPDVVWITGYYDSKYSENRIMITHIHQNPINSIHEEFLGWDTGSGNQTHYESIENLHRHKFKWSHSHKGPWNSFEVEE